MLKPKGMNNILLLWQDCKSCQNKDKIYHKPTLGTPLLVFTKQWGYLPISRVWKIDTMTYPHTRQPCMQFIWEPNVLVLAVSRGPWNTQFPPVAMLEALHCTCCGETIYWQVRLTHSALFSMGFRALVLANNENWKRDYDQYTDLHQHTRCIT